MSLVPDIATILVTAGLVNGNTGWPLFEHFEPELPDQAVVLRQFAGGVVYTKIGLDEPGLQVNVRAAAHATDAAFARIEAIAAVLDGFGSALVGATQVREILADQPAFLRDFDERRRPTVTQNFTVWRSLP